MGNNSNKRKKIYVAIITLLKGLKGFLRGYGGSIKKEHRDKSLVMLANGPSLRSTRIDSFPEEVVYACVNFFPACDERFRKLKPMYLCLFDDVFWNKNTPIELQEQLGRFYYELEKVDWDLVIICCVDEKLPINNSYISYSVMTPIQLVYSENETLRHFMYRKCVVNAGAQNVVTGALFYFINSGYKKIYLAGADMSEFKHIFIDKDNNILIERTHSYEETKEKINYLKYGTVNRGELYILLGKYCKMLKEYHLLSEYAEEEGTMIINLNPDSYIDSFKKDDTFCI